MHIIDFKLFVDWLVFDMLTSCQKIWFQYSMIGLYRDIVQSRMTYIKQEWMKNIFSHFIYIFITEYSTENKENIKTWFIQRGIITYWSAKKKVQMHNIVHRKYTHKKHCTENTHTKNIAQQKHINKHNWTKRKTTIINTNNNIANMKQSGKMIFELF